MEKILEKKSLPGWLEAIGLESIHAPRRENDTWRYRRVTGAESVSFEVTQTVEPVKTHILPQHETLFLFREGDDGNPELEEPPAPDSETVVFAVRPCEGHAVAHTDRVFLADRIDSHYQQRREKTILVGLACNTPPSINCFCTSVGGSPHGEEGLDALMVDLDDRWLVRGITEKGRDLMEKGGKQFSTASRADLEETGSRAEKAGAMVARSVPSPEQAAARMKDCFESSIWENEAGSCIRCGICTYLCPSCHCFDIHDELERKVPLKGKRTRTWDTCQFPIFTMHSSGHNPRPDRASRLRQRLMHKFQYFYELHRTPQCTGCGRCVSHCPVNIDIIEILNKVTSDDR